MLLMVLIFLPLAGALPLLLARDREAREIKHWAFLVSLVTFLASLPLWFEFEPTGKLYQFAASYPWITVGGLQIKFAVGVDGFAALMILLTTFMMPVALLGAFNYIKVRQQEFYIAMLVLETAMIGTFAATDLFLFYLFFEASLIPMYLIIGIWGGEDKLMATTKFVLYTALGSLLMFVAILFIYYKTGGESFGILHLTQKLAELRAAGELSRSAEIWCFWAFVLAFGIKVPLFPLHTWLPNAHVEAPTPGSVILAGVLLKMGGYGFIRFIVPFFPDASRIYIHETGVLPALAIISIIYGSLMALAQHDIKKLIAYSSVAHMGACMLGLFSYQEAGVQGGMYQMLNHGINSGALFLMAGMLYERTHSRMIEHYGGIASSVPAYTICFVIFSLASIGLPLTNGFVGEFACLLGAFLANPWWGLWGGLGVILGAAYMLYLIQRVFYGKMYRESHKQLPDLNRREIALMLPLILLVFVMGMFPTPFFRQMDGGVQEYLARSGVARPIPYGDAPTILATTPAAPSTPVAPVAPLREEESALSLAQASSPTPPEAPSLERSSARSNGDRE
jgi:NADH-quinone oxidoreductase subunit M